jgi:hypothetical protein
MINNPSNNLKKDELPFNKQTVARIILAPVSSSNSLSSIIYLSRASKKNFGAFLRVTLIIWPVMIYQKTKSLRISLSIAVRHLDLWLI